MSNLPRKTLIAAGALCLAAVAVRAEPAVFTVGGSGANWSGLAARWVALDDTTTAGSIQPKELRPWENIMVGPEAGDNLFGFQWHRAQTGMEFAGKELGLHPRVWSAAGSAASGPALLLLDGQEETAFQTLRVVPQDEFNSHATATGGAFSAGFRLDASEAFTFDLGIVVPVERIVFFPRQSGLDAFGVPNANRAPQAFELSVQNRPEGRLLLEGEGRPWGGLETVVLRTLLNSQSLVDLAIPLQPLRFLRLNVGLARQAYSLAEFQVYGRGVPLSAEFVSQVVDLGRPVNFGVIDYALTLLRRTATDQLVEDAAAPVRLVLQTRTGRDDSPLSYWVVNEVGADVEVSREEYDKADPPKSCCLDLRLPGMQSAITDDRQQWTPWSSPYLRPGQENRSADGRRYLQFRFRLETDDVLAYGRLDSLSFRYSPLLARSVIGEVSLAASPELDPLAVPAGQPQTFALDLAADFDAADQPGFDAVRLDVPPDGRFARLEMAPPQGAGGFAEVVPDSVVHKRTEVYVYFPSNRVDAANNRRVRLVLDVTLFNASTVFTGEVIDTQGANLPQSIDAGDADAEALNNGLSVFATQLALPVLDDVTVVPAAMTPNGDGVNDAVTIAYRILGIERGDVDIGIYDLNGRRVAGLSPGPHGPGAYVETWDGRDATGSLVAPGIYACRIRVRTESGDTARLRLVPVAY